VWFDTVLLDQIAARHSADKSVRAHATHGGRASKVSVEAAAGDWIP